MSRDYSKIVPQFWTGETGKWLRKQGADCQVVALYLLTCPSANMIGLYYLPLPTLCHETGLSQQGASKALARLSEGGFAVFDTAREEVWVPQMASYQIGESLKANDKQVLGIERLAFTMRKSRFFSRFVEKYAKAFNLSSELIEAAKASPFQGPSKGLRSQDQDQEQEQEHEQEIAPAGAAPLPFKPEVAVQAIAEASAGRFTAAKLNRGQAINAQRLIRQAPSLSTWTLVGQWLGAGGDGWKGNLDVRHLGDFATWLAHAQKWDANGRGPVNARNGVDRKPGNIAPAAHVDRTYDATEEFGT